MIGQPGWEFCIDRGGTFTDIVSRSPDGVLTTRKYLSDNPLCTQDAALAGIAACLGLEENEPIPPGLITSVRMGTTVATNALLQRRGVSVLLIVNSGFADLLHIGDQSRPDLFALAITRPAALQSRTAEITARIDAGGCELFPVDEDAIRTILKDARGQGIEALAVALIHSWKFPEHEVRIAALARDEGFTQISLSHAVSPHPRLIRRALTSVVDASLSPVLRRHTAELAAALPGTNLLFMQSHGGLAAPDHFSGRTALLSGPAGGIVGAARTAQAAGFGRIIGFDMGGTSTDVALYAGSLDRRFETTIDGLTLHIPSLAIHTVAAGGGSILHFDGTRMRVGPQSAGADPGPRAYRKNGPLTVTDANICLGKILPDQFPALFGNTGDQPLDDEAVHAGFAELAVRMHQHTDTTIDPQALAEGFVRIAVASMAHAIREISVRRGHDPRMFALHCFGGAGGQHACLVAEELEMDTILIHPLAGVLSAYGMGLAELSVIRETALERPLTAQTMPELQAAATALENAATGELLQQTNDPQTTLQTTTRLNLRQAGSDARLACTFASIEAMTAEFADQHDTRFGFAPDQRQLVADSLAVEVSFPARQQIRPEGATRPPDDPLQPRRSTAFWSKGKRHPASLYRREDLRAGDRIDGPSMICEANATTVIEPGWRAEITPQDDVILRRNENRAMQDKPVHETSIGPLQIELFNNLFMTIAGQAGAVLQNTASSVNIRERLDFSCAIFGADGALIANAPHVPVHLGAMGETVRTVLRKRGTSLCPGDVIALNNPFDGGTHLPDITTITPVFDDTGTRILFFAGSRAHHADIGSIVPGSTPAFSRTLEEEGVVIDDFLLVSQGKFREIEFRELLAKSRHPARSPDKNVADIRAQIAANALIVSELHRVLALHGADTLRRATEAVMRNAEECVRHAISKLKNGSFQYEMDDGRVLAVTVRIDHAGRCAEIDFTGTSEQGDDNFNAPPAVLRAVVLYVFRCLAADDIPLNDGCLAPLRIIVPPGTFLSPRPGAAVVAGNTEVSQAACNALFGALGTIACSQGTMNNLLFGDAERQYYETICGGTGAGPDFDGASAVQSHMTNTRMTDPEYLEMRFPVRVERFAIRSGSGGDGAHRGGDGVVRSLRFLEPMQMVLVSSRRTVPPFGLQGGGSGQPGRQYITRAGTDGSVEAIAGIAQMQLSAGDLLTIETPGGGGFGNR